MNKLRVFLILLFFSLKCIAQKNDTIFFDKNWKESKKELAQYYRIQPKKIKTKEAIGYKIKDVDSLYVINDYYLLNDNLQFKGYSFDKEGENLVGTATWYSQDNKTSDSRNFNYQKRLNETKFKLPDWPILYVSYSIATKSQFTGGLEFCADCNNQDKLFLGIGYGITSYDGKYYGLPDFHLSYNRSKKDVLFLKTGVSTKHAYALSGISLLNAMDLGFGYSFPFNEEKIPVIKGFTFGVTFRLTKNKDAIPQMNFM